jgi:hypothetical protein
MADITNTPQTDLIISMQSIIKSAIKQLKENGVDDIRITHLVQEMLPTSAIAIWTKEDYTQAAFELGLIDEIEIISDDTAQGITEYIMNKHDATIGINWDVVEIAVQQILMEERAYD